MAYIPKDWRDATTYSGGGDTSTPISAASLEDLEIRVTDYADTLVDPPATASDMLFGFADDEDNHQDFYADALATGANSARIGVGYNAPGSAASLAAVAAYEADDQVTQVVVYLWSTTVISAATWATQAALACTQYPNALIELINEPNLNSFGGYTYTQAADATIAAVNACPAGRIIGPAVSQIGEQLGGDYLSYQAQMYDRIFDSVSPAQMAGVAFHLYPVTADPVGEMETHVDACYTAGLEQLPVFITEVGYQWGIYNLYQGWSSANLFNTYYNDARVGGIFYYRLAPQQPTPLEGETFQRYPLTTNASLESELTAVFNDPPGGDPAPYAPLDSPTFTGDPKAPTPLPGDNDTSVATSEFVTKAIHERLFRPEDYGAERDGVTDDTVALQECIDAAMAYSAVFGNAVVQLGVGTYLVDEDPRTDRSGYCILSILDELWSQAKIEIRGVAGAVAPAAAYLNPTLYESRSVILTTRTTDAYDADFGHPSVLGGGTEENGIVADTIYTGLVTLRDFVIKVPTDPAIGGIDAISWGGVDARDVMVVSGEPEDGPAETLPTHTNAFGWRGPPVWGNNTGRWVNCVAVQFYVGFVITSTDHQFWQACNAYKCVIGYGIQVGGTTGGGYPIIGHYWMIEGTPYCIAGWNPVSGLAAIDRDIWFSDMLVQTEHSSLPAFNPVVAIYDTNNFLHGRLDWHHWALGTYAGVPGAVSGAEDLDIRTPHAGHMVATRQAAPADGDLMTGQAQVWHDRVAGTPQLKVKSKDSGGTVKQYSIVGGEFAVWKTIFEAKCFLNDGMTSGFPQIVGSAISDDTSNRVRSVISSEGMPLQNDHNAAAVTFPISPPEIFYLDDDDWDAFGLTTWLRIRMVIMVNATAPAQTFTVTLGPTDSDGAGDSIAYSMGTSVATLAIASPAANGPSQNVGSSFAVPADGPHHFIIGVGGTPTSGFAGSLHCSLQMSHTIT